MVAKTRKYHEAFLLRQQFDVLLAGDFIVGYWTKHTFTFVERVIIPTIRTLPSGSMVQNTLSDVSIFPTARGMLAYIPSLRLASLVTTRITLPLKRSTRRHSIAADLSVRRTDPLGAFSARRTHTHTHTHTHTYTYAYTHRYSIYISSFYMDMSWALLSNANYLADPISGPAGNVNAMYHKNFITVEYSGSVMFTSSSFTSCTSEQKATIVVRNACMAFHLFLFPVKAWGVLSSSSLRRETAARHL